MSEKQASSLSLGGSDEARSVPTHLQCCVLPLVFIYLPSDSVDQEQGPLLTVPCSPPHICVRTSVVPLTLTLPCPALFGASKYQIIP